MDISERWEENSDLDTEVCVSSMKVSLTSKAESGNALRFWLPECKFWLLLYTLYTVLVIYEAVSVQYTLCQSYMKQCTVHTVLFTSEAVYNIHGPSPASEAVHSNFRMVYYGVPNLLKCCTFVLLDWNVFLGTLHFVTCSLYFSAAKLDDNIVLAPVTV